MIQERFVADTFGRMSATELDLLERCLREVRDRVRETDAAPRLDAARLRLSR